MTSHLTSFRLLQLVFVTFTLNFGQLAIAQTNVTHTELSPWIARSVKTFGEDPFTDLDRQALTAQYASVHEDLENKIGSEASALALTSDAYLDGTEAQKAQIKFSNSIEVSPSVASEDLWYSFLLLKMRRITQRNRGDYSYAYLKADAVGFYKLLAIIAEFKNRGLNLPCLNKDNSMNFRRPGESAQPRRKN